MTAGLDRTALIACCGPTVIITVDFAVVSVLAPQIRSELALSGGELAWLISGYSLGYGMFLLAAGRCADVLGRRRVLLAGLALFAAAATAVSTATTAQTAITARVLQGVGAAVMLPASLSLLTAAEDGRARNPGAAAYGLAIGLGFAAGALASGAIAAVGSWRLGMALIVPCSLTVAAAAWRLAPPAAAAARRGVSLAGSIGVGCLVAAGTVGADAEGLLGILVPAAAGAALLVFAGRLGRRLTGRARPVAAACATSAVITGTGVAATLLLTLLLQDARGHSPLAAGCILACFGAAAVPGARAARRIGARRAPRALVAAGLALQGAALLAAAAVTDGADVVLAACVAGFGFGHVVGNAAAASVATAGAPSGVHGVLAGTLGASQRLGGALGPLLVARLGTDGAVFQRGMAVSGACALAVAAIAWVALRGVHWPAG